MLNQDLSLKIFPSAISMKCLILNFCPRLYDFVKIIVWSGNDVFANA